MTRVQLEISDQLAAAVERRADARGVSTSRYVTDLIQQDVASAELTPANDSQSKQPRGVSGILRHLAPADPVSTEAMQRAVEAAAAERFQSSTSE